MNLIIYAVLAVVILFGCLFINFYPGYIRSIWARIFGTAKKNEAMPALVIQPIHRHGLKELLKSR